MEYREILPSPDLQPWIRCFWTLSGDAGTPYVERVLPDGCVEWVFHYESDFQRLVDGVYQVQPRSMVAGQIGRYIMLRSGGKTEVLGVRFQTWGAFAFFPCPAFELNEQSYTLEEVFGKEGKVIEAQVLDRNPMEAIGWLQGFFRHQLKQISWEEEQKLKTVLAWCRPDHRMSVSDLADNLGWSSRHLERRFQDLVGLSPKRVSGILRLQRVLHHAREQPDQRLTELAYQSGYYDQAHFIREFKSFAGVTPKAFFAGEQILSDLQT